MQAISYLFDVSYKFFNNTLKGGGHAKKVFYFISLKERDS